MVARRRSAPSVSFFAFQDIITAVVGIFILITIILILELVQRVEAAGMESEAPSEAEPIVVEPLRQEVRDLRETLRERTGGQVVGAELNAFNREQKLAVLRASVAEMDRKIRSTNEQIRAANRELQDAEVTKAQLADRAATSQPLIEQMKTLKGKESRIRQEIELLSEDATGIFRDRLEDGRYLTLVTLIGKSIEVRDARDRQTRSFRGPRRLDEFRSWLDERRLANRHLLLRIKPGGASDYQALAPTLAEGRVNYGYTVVGEDEAVRLGFELEAN